MSASLAPECNDVKEYVFRKTLKEKGIDAMVEEARVRAKETDQEYMKKQYSPVVASDERV
ncbi:hypothetical protein KEM54_002497 [Ascosphaera aggregata]|nr:hypothetical protein KEM54_002497 [Ascosphaera aggregata]